MINFSCYNYEIYFCWFKNKELLNLLLFLSLFYFIYQVMNMSRDGLIKIPVGAECLGVVVVG